MEFKKPLKILNVPYLDPTWNPPNLINTPAEREFRPYGKLFPLKFAVNSSYKKSLKGVYYQDGIS